MPSPDTTTSPDAATAEPDTTSLTDAPTEPDAPDDAPAEPRNVRRQRLARTAVLATVFTCAACGLVYELALVALGSYLIGDTVGQASIVLAVMVFAMGLGALAAKPLQKHAATAFAAIEIILAFCGGLSVLGLYAAFAWLDLYVPALVVMALLLGLLIGAEIPLLMVLLQRIRRQDAGEAVADLFAADYIGALLGGLAFPFLLLPVFGQIQGALVVGGLNAVAGLGLVLGAFRRDITRRARVAITAGAVVVALVLGFAYAVADDFEVTARQQLYAAPVVYAKHTRYQDIVITESISLAGQPDVRLYLNGDLQFSSIDEYRYHEALIHPAMAGAHRNVLVLGGGDGLAVREILRYPDVETVTLVELDPAMTALARTYKRLTDLNRHSLDDPRVRVVNADAFGWLRDRRGRYDVVVADLPDPNETATAKLFSVEFYALIKPVLTSGGRLVVQAGSPYFAPRSYWCTTTSVETAGYGVTPYHVDVPTFGDWGFLLATSGPAPTLTLDPTAPPMRFLSVSVLTAAAVFGLDRSRVDVPASTLMHPRILEYARSEWKNY